MPRLKQPQTKQPQGNPNLPDTGSIVVDLNKAPAPPEQKLYGPENAPKQEVIDPKSIAIDRPIPEVRTAVEPADDDYDAEKELKRTRERAKTRREQNLEATVQTLTGFATQQANEAAAAKHEVTKSHLDTVSSALAQAEAEATAAEEAYAAAWAKGDGLGVAKAQRAISDATYRINTLKAGKDELETMVRQPPTAAQPPVNASLEHNLARMTNLLPEEKDWIRQHPDSIEPANLNHLRVAFEASQRKGLKRGTQDYFDFLSDRLGYEDDGGEQEETPVREPVRQPPERPRVSAPVSRNGGNPQQLRPGQVMLTESQRQIAKATGVSEVEYARGVQRLLEEKSRGLYPSG